MGLRESRLTLLQSHLGQVLGTRPGRLIIHLSQVAFMGSAALSVLLSIRHAAVQQSITLQLRGTQRRVVAIPLHHRDRPLVSISCARKANAGAAGAQHDRCLCARDDTSCRSHTQTAIMVEWISARWPESAVCLRLCPSIRAARPSLFRVRCLHPRPQEDQRALNHPVHFRSFLAGSLDRALPLHPPSR
jgi:hypothetical protein